MIGELINHYRVEELIGRGAMGVVYKALDVNIDRQVAIKVMSVEARNDPAFVERFRQEARMQGALNHPHIALLFDYFIHNDAPIAVMEFIDGESFDQLIRRRGAIPAHESIPIFKQALLGVAAAHRAGIIHRDLKAANLMINRDGIVKVMDFGVAKRHGAMDATKASTSVGSPLCMAPEQILGRTVDVRTDVYALGVTLYQLLTGQPPFNPRGKSEYSVLNAHVNDLPDPPSVHRRDIPAPVVSAVMRAMAKEPTARFQSADEFMRALPDIATPPAAAPAGIAPSMAATPTTGPTGTMVIPRTGPTGTMVIAQPVGAVSGADQQLGPTGTLVIERPATTSPSATPAARQAGPTVPERSSLPTAAAIAVDRPNGNPPGEPAAMRRDPSNSTVIFDYAPPTTPQALSNADTAPAAAIPTSAPERRGPWTDFRRSLRASHVLIAAALIATLLLGNFLRRTDWVDALMGPSPSYHSPVYETLSAPAAIRARTATQIAASASTKAPSAPALAPAQPPVPAPAQPPVPAPLQTQAQAPPSAESAATAVDVANSAVAQRAVPQPKVATAKTMGAPDTAAAVVRQGLSGVWRGEYVDASGRQLLRVVSLRIRQVRDDGGIEGMLRYQAASGAGECKLHPTGSSYSADAQRLQLSPEGCTPHYPKELGVPLDFDGVKPQASFLKDGHIEAPAGAVIRVKLRRVDGI